MIWEKRLVWGFKVILIGLLPLIFGWMTQYFSGQAYVRSLPIAIVNQDNGAKYGQENYNIGATIIRKIRTNETIDWRIVTKKSAQQGLANGDYVGVVTLPKNLSAQMVQNLTQTGVKPLAITYQVRPETLTVGRLLTYNVAQGLEKRIRSAVRQKALAAAETMLTSKVGQYDTATQAGTQLAAGAQTLQTGIQRYTAGTSQLAAGIQSLHQQLADLPSGLAQLSAGASALQTGIDAYTRQVDDAATDVSTAAAALPVAQLTQLRSFLQNTDTQVALQSVAASAPQYADLIQMLLTQPDVFAQVEKLAGQATRLQKASQQLRDGSATLTAGVAQLQTQGNKLTNGVAALNDGAQKLTQYNQILNSGAAKFAAGTQTFADRLGAVNPKATTANISQLKQALALPLRLQEVQPVQSLWFVVLAVSLAGYWLAWVLSELAGKYLSRAQKIVMVGIGLFVVTALILPFALLGEWVLVGAQLLMLLLLVGVFAGLRRLTGFWTFGIVLMLFIVSLLAYSWVGHAPWSPLTQWLNWQNQAPQHDLNGMFVLVMLLVLLGSGYFYAKKASR
ncbi:MAG TPA: hypothetical protein VGM95_03090 [Lactobacillaceae bacterium]|jgi:YhgE/Pip-like protein